MELYTVGRLFRAKRWGGKDRAVLEQLSEPRRLGHLDARGSWQSRRGGGALDDRQIIAVHQAALVKVDHEGVCSQKIGANDALADVGHDERPAKLAALELEAEGSDPKQADCRSVGCDQGRAAVACLHIVG